MRQALALLAQQREQLLAERGDGPAHSMGSSGFMGRRLHWLLLAAAGYGQSLLSKADVAALLLSRRILLLPEDPVRGSRKAAIRAGGTQWLQ